MNAHLAYEDEQHSNERVPLIRNDPSARIASRFAFLLGYQKSIERTCVRTIEIVYII